MGLRPSLRPGHATALTFFPAERVDRCVDGHCWVATRHHGKVLDWDIAHHIKAGLDPVCPALNPKPGRRALMSHSMGHRYATAGGEIVIKVLGEPVWLLPGGGVATSDRQEIRAF